MVFKATFNNITVISWWSILLMEETGISGENHLLHQMLLKLNYICLNLISLSCSKLYAGKSDVFFYFIFPTRTAIYFFLHFFLFIVKTSISKK
jgi:hypothetical protein